jgi:hypothetical protein
VGAGCHPRYIDRQETIVSYGTDLDIEYDDPSGDLEIEVEANDAERGRFGERGQKLLQDLDRSHVLDLLGR